MNSGSFEDGREAEWELISAIRPRFFDADVTRALLNMQARGTSWYDSFLLSVKQLIFEYSLKAYVVDQIFWEDLGGS